MSSDVRGFDEIDGAEVALAGGKAAQLARLSRLEGIRVPSGFVVVTDAFDRVVSGIDGVDELVERLSLVDPGERDVIGDVSARIRRSIEATAVPDDLVAAITASVVAIDEDGAWAVRSSATAEDLPSASFAGQQDSYLNVVGAAAIVEQMRRCWASLYTERAVVYRARHGFAHHGVRMAVVVQQLVDADASGVMFTADPVTANRSLTTIEATPGLGEALVSGRVNPDSFVVRDGELIAREIARKGLMIESLPGGGTAERELPPDHGDRPALRDEQVVRLAQLGDRIEAHLGGPQDIEWCLSDDEFHFVQSRPITTLFPAPAIGDGQQHVYVSVGHQQMMTDPMKPLGLSLFQLTARPPMHEAAGRLFVEVTQILASPATRTGILDDLGRSDPLIGDALQTLLDRGDVIPVLPDPGPAGAPPVTAAAAVEADAVEIDPAVVEELIAATDASVAAARHELSQRSGVELVEFLLDDIAELKRVLFDPRSSEAIRVGMEAAWWLNDHLLEWLGEKNVADTLSQSVSHSVTSEMGLALLEVADAVRPHPRVVAALELIDEAHPLELGALAGLDGGREVVAAFEAFLTRYGMRCVGEIDITRPRWSERPGDLVPAVLTDVRNFEAGAGARRFEHGRAEALATQREVLDRLRALPGGQDKADAAARMIDRVRNFSGFREYPKYGMICRYAVYKQALLGEAERLVASEVLDAPEDIYFLTLPELLEVVRSGVADRRLIAERTVAHRANGSLTPPRVLTSDGEALSGQYRRDDVPDGALVGLAVSSGTVEGRARVIHDIGAADIEAGDILVTAFTDPSWSPVFVAIGGLVTEVGGLMTHGAVVAREYGLPAVVGVEHATRLIRDGQRIRVHGSDGYVEILDAGPVPSPPPG